MAKTEPKQPEPRTEFCKMNSNNQITVPQKVREAFIGKELEGDQTVLWEVKFIRALQPTQE